MSGLPFLQFYPADWMKDTRALSPETKGAWIDILCALHFSTTRGKLSLTIDGWARVIGQSTEKTRICVDELRMLSTCDHTECNGVVTLISRRMLRESITKEQTRQRVAKLRDKKRKQEESKAQLRQSNALCNAPVIESNGEEAQKLISSEAHNQIQIAPAPPSRAESPKPKKERVRDPLFDALASVCGSDPLQMTAPAARGCAVALAAIRKVAPDVKPEEFESRAAIYCRLYEGAALTPFALMGHWAECTESNPLLQRSRNLTFQERRTSELAATKEKVAESYRTTPKGWKTE